MIKAVRYLCERHCVGIDPDAVGGKTFRGSCLASKQTCQSNYKELRLVTKFHGKAVFLASQAEKYLTEHNLIVDGRWRIF